MEHPTLWANSACVRSRDLRLCLSSPLKASSLAIYAIPYVLYVYANPLRNPEHDRAANQRVQGCFYKPLAGFYTTYFTTRSLYLHSSFCENSVASLVDSAIAVRMF